MWPAIDGTRPGAFFANTHAPTDRLRPNAEAVAFHEAVPGHHVQISLAQQLTDLPLLRRVYIFDAYAEGWGLYSERLADEMGLYSDDIARLGMLSTDARRAARLVTDTGLHAMGWSRDQAVAYCRDNTPMAPGDIDNEIDRYIGCPGPALTYVPRSSPRLRLASPRCPRPVAQICSARSCATSTAISMARVASGDWVRPAGQCRRISRAGDGCSWWMLSRSSEWASDP